MISLQAIGRLLLSITLTASCPSWAQALYEHFDQLETRAAQAYEGHDADLFESRFSELRSEYHQRKRLQEEIWALYHFDYDKEAARLENDLRLRLKTEKIVQEKWLPLGRATVRKAVLESGIWVVLREQPESGIGPSVRHDVMVYEIDRALGFHLVPVTVSRPYNDGMVSLQMLIRDNLPGDESYVRQPYTNERLHILDFLTQQLDRHFGNWLKAPGGHVVAIDNDIVYGHDRYAEARKQLGAVSADEPPAFLSPENRRAIERLQKSIDQSPEKFNMTSMETVSLQTKIKVLLSLPSACQAYLHEP